MRCTAKNKDGTPCRHQAILLSKCIAHFSNETRRKASNGWEIVLRKYVDKPYARSVLQHYLRQRKEYSRFMTLLAHEQFDEAERIIRDIIAENGVELMVNGRNG